MRSQLYLSTTAFLLLALPYASVATTKSGAKSGPDDIPSASRFNFFDAELLQAVAKAHPGNVLVSPMSVKAMLAMILEGAGGESAEQIRTALRLPENQEAIRNVFYKFITSVVEPSPGIKLEMASRVFMAKHLQPSHAYSTRLIQHYYSDLVKVDFTTPDMTARIINDWVKQLTRGLIPKLVEADNLQPDTQAVLTNAVYFKGKWKVPFNQESTNVKCFYTSPGVCRPTNMMETLEFFNYNYIRELDADALELPYEGNKYSMLLLAPKEVDGMIQLKRDIVHVPVHSIVASLEPAEVLVSLPRFEIDFSIDLVPTLHTLGIREIFGPNSNLTGMFAGSEVSAQVSNMFHKAKIIVNEAGSEAAAGTGALVVPLMGSAISKFRADRPFLFYIRDMTTGIVLFAGRVSVPEAASNQYQKPQPPSQSEIDNIFSGMVVPTLIPSQSNSGSSGQVYRPTAATTVRPSGSRPSSVVTNRWPNRRTTTPAAVAATSSTTEGREISQNSPTKQQNSNVHYPSTADESRNSPYNPSSQRTGTSTLNNNYPQYEGNKQYFNSPDASISTYSNPQNTFSIQNSDRREQVFSQNPNVHYSRSAVPMQHNTYSNSVLRPELNRPNILDQSSQTNTQNRSPSYTPNGSQSNTQYNNVPNYQNTDQQSNDRGITHQNTNPRNSGFESQNYSPMEIQHSQISPNTKQVVYAQFQPAHPPLYLPYPIPGKTVEYQTNTRESHQASSQRPTPYTSVVVRNENPLPAPGTPIYQQPQSQDRDAIQFASQHRA